MDFAFYENGYVYHTYNDVAEIIPMGSYQNAGDNILAITVAAANAAELPDTSVSYSEKIIKSSYFKTHTILSEFFWLKSILYK